MKLNYIKLSDLEPGIIYKILCASYQGWENSSKHENDWKQFDEDVHDFPDTVGSSGFGTFLGNTFVGFISWDPRQFPSHVIVGHNCVLPEYRNQGIGKHQITRALNSFQQYGFEFARVSTKRDTFFKYARKMYESCGFVECSPYRDNEENMIYYSIELKNH
ncbi:GNAT family N-acetyltransferase [candidate division KSB1 bacterium]|nr:GNAT family N-acetyltransferase [candidate division KSB1 bacterium]